jgi:quinol-cytochrome oxidoreductase complex cytochrome b subunit
LHLISLHENGSNNPLGISANVDRIRFHPYYSFKDLVGVFLFFLILAYFIFYNPNFFGEPINYIPANPLVTPVSIVPEFYLLPFYAILRSIPSKLLGVIAMLFAILILLVMPIMDTSRIRSAAFRPIYKFFFWAFVANFIILGWIGSQHPEEPLIMIGRCATGFYFSYFLVFVPVIGIIENTLFDLGTKFRSNIKTPLSFITQIIKNMIVFSIIILVIRAFFVSLKQHIKFKIFRFYQLLQSFFILMLIQRKSKS